MTTALELKAMLREEIDAPLDTPRIAGESGILLESYNEGFRRACMIVLTGSENMSIWIGANRIFLARVVLNQRFSDEQAESSRYFADGMRDAYKWALAELEALESDSPVTAVEEEDGMIVVSRRDGTRSRFDMATARAIGDLAYNLALEETF